MEQESDTAGMGRPRVVVAVGASVDGRITLRRDSRLMDKDVGRIWGSMWPPSPPGTAGSRSSVDLYQYQAVLEGSGSLVADSAGPLTGLPTEYDEPTDVLYTDFLPEEVVEKPDVKWFTAVDSRGRVHWDRKSGGGFDALVLVARATPGPYLAYLRKQRICYLVAGEERVDLAVALRRMHDRLGVTSVESTAGGGLNGALLRAGLVDEISLTLCPAAVGGLGTPTIFDGPELADGQTPTRLRLISAQVESNGVIWLRYEVLREGT
ncbi:RibD family protein [Actinopolymorpha sp. B9G3]|uniref:RibD family protein n=1 Tax=Actinopolymorpha sp. B9G3 TaxID=3158970 RepID=UPI0032D97B1A